jgi:hypothetical protein
MRPSPLEVHQQRRISAVQVNKSLPQRLQRFFASEACQWAPSKENIFHRVERPAWPWRVPDGHLRLPLQNISDLSKRGCV